MWIQVRSMDGKKSVRLDNLSKLTKIEEVRKLLVEEFDAKTDEQRLFCRGKQLENGHTLFDYGIGLNEIVQLLVQKKLAEPSPKKTPKKQQNVTDKENVQPNAEPEPEPEIEPEESTSSGTSEPEDGEGESTYKLGDIIDVRDEKMGAWFESKLIKITRNKNKNALKDKKSTKDDIKENGVDESDDVVMIDDDKEATPDDGVTADDGFLYHIVFEGYEEDPPIPVPVKNVRPRGRVYLDIKEIEVGRMVMLNFNYDQPQERGYWYDAIITKKEKKNITATVFIGKDLMPMKDCKIKFSNEIFAVEKAGDQLNLNSGASSPIKRTNKADCDFCKDNPRKKCKECSCTKCGDKKDPDKTIMCDECDSAWHLYCLDPPMTELPEEDEWFCPLCKNDENEVVKAGEKLKESKKKAKMPSANTASKRDWGKGMACAGRQKTCSVVPGNHFGPIPGVEVGQSWKFRVGVSESGVHRPHVAGISGTQSTGSYSIVLSGGYEDDKVSEAGIHRPPVAGIAGSALVGSQSIVLSGGYEDDKDDGETFTYTGAGGRDLSGNKRTAEQSCDQVLTLTNMALARNVAAPLDKKNGGDAGDKWRDGKPVRVVRNYKGAKHSKYAPVDGNRYDGIYKVIRYWPEKGKAGFIVWRYEMRRDDPTPPPWTEEGQKRIDELGLEMMYPEGYEEKEAAKEKEKERKEKEKKGKGKGKGKRKRIDSGSSSGEASAAEEAPAEKKAKTAPKKAYKVPDETHRMIKEDTLNKKVWNEALEHVGDTAKKFFEKVEELITCAICMDLPVKPITMECGHNICKSCLQRSFKAEQYNCPQCRHELGKDYNMRINTKLAEILNKLFPGYETGR